MDKGVHQAADGSRTGHASRHSAAPPRLPYSLIRLAVKD